MKVQLLDFHTLLRLDPDPKKPPQVFERGIHDLPEAKAKDLIARGKATLPGKEEKKSASTM